MNNIYVIGIDPGKNGGIVALRNGHLVDISPMPANPATLYAHFKYLGFPRVTEADETYIFIENVHSMPKDGIRAAFTFGRGLGHIEAILAVVSPVEPIKVNPSQWMKYYELVRDKDMMESKYDFKKRIKEKAIECAPAKAASKVTLKTCDAYLIAEYGYRMKKFGISPIPIKDNVKSTKDAGLRKAAVESALYSAAIESNGVAEREIQTRQRSRLVSKKKSTSTPKRTIKAKG